LRMVSFLEGDGGFSCPRQDVNGDWAFGALDLTGREITEAAGLSTYINLSDIDLSDNQLTTMIDCTALVNLQSLSLNKNGISSIGATLVALPALRQLAVCGNELSGDLTNLPPSLLSLQLDANQIEAITGIETLAALKTLELRNNKITNLVGIAGEALEELHLTGNLLRSTEGLEAVAGSLKVLSLDANRLEVVAGLGETNEVLRKIDLSGNRIAGFEGIEVLRGVPGLEELSLEGNPLQELPDYKKHMIIRIPSLKILDGVDILREERQEVEEWHAEEEKRRLAAEEAAAE